MFPATSSACALARQPQAHFDVHATHLGLNMLPKHNMNTTELNQNIVSLSRVMN